MRSDTHDTAGIVAPPPLIYLGGLIFGGILSYFVPRPLLDGWLKWVVGLPLILLGAGGLAWAFLTLRRARTSVDPYEPTTAIVSDGPYRFTRNPIYFSFALVYPGFAVLLNLAWAILLLPAVLMIVDRGVIAREERYLERKFGEVYLRYKARVRRWL